MIAKKKSTKTTAAKKTLAKKVPVKKTLTKKTPAKKVLTKKKLVEVKSSPAETPIVLAPEPTIQANVAFKKKKIGAPFIFKNIQLKKPVNSVPTEFDRILEDIIKIKPKNRIITNEQYNIAKKQWAAVLSQYTSLWSLKHGFEFASQIAHIALWNALKRFENGRNCSWKSYLHATMNWEYSAQTRVSIIKPPCSLQTMELDPSNSEILELNVRIKEEFGEAIEKLCKFLNPQEKDILFYRIKGFKLDEIGKIYKISKERVRQIQGKVAFKAKNMVYKKLINF